MMWKHDIANVFKKHEPSYLRLWRLFELPKVNTELKQNK